MLIAALKTEAADYVRATVTSATRRCGLAVHNGRSRRPKLTLGSGYGEA